MTRCLAKDCRSRPLEAGWCRWHLGAQVTHGHQPALTDGVWVAMETGVTVEDAQCVVDLVGGRPDGGRCYGCRRSCVRMWSVSQGGVTGIEPCVTVYAVCFDCAGTARWAWLSPRAAGRPQQEGKAPLGVSP